MKITSVDTEFAPSERSQRRRRGTLLRVQTAAIRLTLDRGLDGFTMDDLAEQVDVSRRTLFNYVGDKLTAVLGADEALTDARVAEFIATETSGRPLETLMRLVLDWVEESDPGVDLNDVARQLQRAIANEPRLTREVVRRGSQVVARMSDLLVEKEGWSADDVRARVIASTVQTLLNEATKRTLDATNVGAVTHTENVRAVFAAFRDVTAVPT